MKTKLSMVVLAAIGMVSLGNAVELKTTGEAVVYGQTSDAGANDLFDKAGSAANVGLRVNVAGDLGNDVGIGVEGVALGTLGLEKNLVSNVMQTAGNSGELNDAALSQIYVTKKIDNTTLKLGRQELPAAVSPLAFSEDWNVFKNTYDAAVAINSDLPDTTLVGAWVSSNGDNDRSNLSGYINSTTRGAVEGGGYMLTAVNKSIKELPFTLSYYDLEKVAGGEAGNAIWASTKVDAGLPVTLALQGGQINPENALKETNAFGAEIGAKVDVFDLGLAYSSVDDGALGVVNTGGVKTPLFTQMVANEGAIARDADTVVLKASTPIGAGTVSAAYGMVSAGAANSDTQELNLAYGFKAMGTDMLLAYVNQDGDAATAENNIVRFVSRYNF
ncbi:MAG: hypothetical protein KN64_12280 [Sulfurovum sp. AS07-7]|nr:MAG: hypothetical protein KN64_12280 [Sulfurovum sp. AS07-7]